MAETAETTTPEPHSGGSGVVVRGLRKTFGGVPALDDISLDVRPGEIHGLLGQNGSGKSTLIKVLAGFHEPDAGTLTVDGRPISLPLSPGQFQELGFAFVHQDLGLIPSLSVLENLRLPFFVSARRPTLSWRALHRDARDVLRSYGVDVDTRARLGDLAPVERSMLAIVRAVESLSETEAGRGHLLVLDEPTVYLPQREVEMLFRLVRQVAAAGTGVLFVSHDLDEVLEICDRVTVLRDGHLVDTVPVREITKAGLVELIIARPPAQAPQLGLPAIVVATADGRQQPASDGAASTAGSPAVARIASASGVTLREITFDIGHGEIVGATGLAGSGFQELPYVLYGAVEGARGRMTLAQGQRLDLARLRPNRAVDDGIILVPGNRQVDGCIQTLTISENISIPTIARFFRRLVLRPRLERTETQRVLERFGVRPPTPLLRVGNLSGGNQQKVLLAKWLQIGPQLLLFDEPTQGVDVGAREEIFAILRAETALGAGVLCASSDHEQLATICDRVLIFAHGHVVSELKGDQVTKEEITRQCLTSVP